MNRFCSALATGAAVLGLALAVAQPAACEPSGLEPAFGNTIVSTHPDGRQAMLWLNADHTFQAEGRAGNRSAGAWQVRRGRLCLTQRRPVPIPFSYCHAYPHVSVGARWADMAVNGDHVTNRVVAGR